MEHYKSCRLCPRDCGVNRIAGETGFCGETDILRIGTAVIHCGEEPPLTGQGGSGTIFVSGCNLGCSFCQNYQVSKGENDASGGRKSLGKAVTPGEFAQICIALCDKGAENINIVTGSHAIPGITAGIDAAREKGVNIPVLWNSSGYEAVNALELLKNHVDIFLPDLKTLDSGISSRFFNASDYPETAAAAIIKMIDIISKKAVENAKEKIIIRHLILPGYLDSTYSVLRWFAQNAKDRAMLSLMTQYTPVTSSHNKNANENMQNAQAVTKREMPQRYLSEEEYETVMYWLKKLDIEDGFCQELVTGNDWLPDFRLINPFSSELSIPVWSCLN